MRHGTTSVLFCEGDWFKPHRAEAQIKLCEWVKKINKKITPLFSPSKSFNRSREVRKQGTQPAEDVKQSRQPWLSPLQTLAAHTPPPLRCSHTHWKAASTVVPNYTWLTLKKNWPWLQKPVGLFLLLWWRFYACYAWGGKTYISLHGFSQRLILPWVACQTNSTSACSCQLMRITAFSSWGLCMLKKSIIPA